MAVAEKGRQDEEGWEMIAQKLTIQVYKNICEFEREYMVTVADKSVVQVRVSKYKPTSTSLNRLYHVMSKAMREPYGPEVTIFPEGFEANWMEKDELVSLSAIIQALENEIEWSKGNVHLAPNQNDADWFIKGLEQARWLILEVSKLDSQDDLSTLEPKEDSPTGTPGWMGDYGGIPHGPFDA